MGKISVSAERWSSERANAWYEQQGWLVGCNFIPSTAVNQLEMWQAETFDKATIDRELSWAADLGFNTLRVFLHDLLWQHDAEGLKTRMDTFLSVAASHRIKAMFVFFDDCWYEPTGHGPQPAPQAGLHNSRWLKSPGRAVVTDPKRWAYLRTYVQDILSTFANDERVLMWDLYNEVGNHYLPSLALPQPQKAFTLLNFRLRQRFAPNASLELLRATFTWAREVNPSQPLTSSIWIPDPRLDHYLLKTADVVTFHNYKNEANLKRQIKLLKTFGRPVLCTEYMARTKKSLFETHLPIFKAEKVGCYNWGLVSGKTQTIYTWKDAGQRDEPELWYHDIFRPDGTPFSQAEVTVIRELTRRVKQTVR
jgi:hypothetical protein